MDRELAAMEEEEAALERQLSELTTDQPGELSLAAMAAAYEQLLDLNRRHLEVRQAMRALKAQRAAHSEQAADDAAWRAAQDARRRRVAEHVPGGGSQGSSGTASSDGSSADTADLQRDLGADLAQLTLGGGGQQAEAPAGGTGGGQQAEAPASDTGGRGQQAEAPASGTAVGRGSTHATPPAGEALGGADDDASPNELQPVFGQHGAGEPAVPAGRPVESAPGRDSACMHCAKRQSPRADPASKAAPVAAGDGDWDDDSAWRGGVLQRGSGTPAGPVTSP